MARKVGSVYSFLFAKALSVRITGRKLLDLRPSVEAVIGLPANLFFGTGIPAAILVFNKGKTHGDVLFIDASREFKDAKNQTVLTEAHLDKIVATYHAFKTAEKYAYRATPQELADNDFNLRESVLAGTQKPRFNPRPRFHVPTQKNFPTQG